MKRTEDQRVCFDIPIGSERDDVSHSIVIILTIVLNGLSSVLAVLQNSTIIWTIFRNSDLHHPSYALLACLAVSDLLTGAIVQPATVAYGIGKYYRIWETFCNATYIIITLSSLLSGVSLEAVTLMSIDRFLALHFHLRYNELVTIPRVLTAIMLLCPILPITLIPKFQGNLKIFVLVLLVISTIYSTAILFFYWKIFRITQRHERQIRSLENAMHQGPSRERILKIKKSSFTFFIITMLLFASLIPYTAYCLRIVIIGYQGFVLPFGDLSITLVLTNASINPLIYFWRLRELKNSVKREIKLCFSY